MKINDPFQINDWNIKIFLKIVFSLQLSIWGVLGLNYIGFNLPVIRQVLCFVYLLFVPGIIILRILKLHNLGRIETLLFTIGLSISTLMFTGLFMNTFYPFFNILKPLTPLSLIITISFVVVVLCILCYFTDADFFEPSVFEVNELFSINVLLLLLVPFLSIFGTYLVNYHKTNFLILILLVVVSFIIISIGFDKFHLDRQFYPLSIFIISISLLFHQSLISTHVFGWDIQNEYYLSNLVITNSFWNSSIYYNVNAMLSIVMLVPIFTNVCFISSVWVFKIIYPFIFSLVPLALYQVFKKQATDKIALLACFFFVTVNTFYMEMPALARQQIAEFFAILLILLLVETNIDKFKKSFLAIVFGISLVVSHYGLSYIYMGMFVFSVVICKFYNSNIYRILSNISPKFNLKKYNFSISNIFGDCINNTNFSLTFILLYTVFLLSWYIFISSSSSFESIVRMIYHIETSFFSDFLNPESVQGLNVLATPTYSLITYIHKIISFLNQIFIIIGVVSATIFRPNFVKFKNQFPSFSIYYLSILFASVSVPFFASSINISRIYQICLIFLSPFLIFGFLVCCSIIEFIINFISKPTSSRISSFFVGININKYLKIFSIYLVIFFLFQVGFISEVILGSSNSIALSNNLEYDYPRYNEQEILSANWLYSMKNQNSILVDEYRNLLLKGFDWNINTTNKFDNSSFYYIYLGTFNSLNHEFSGSYLLGANKFKKFSNLNKFIYTKNLIYSNGGSEIYSQ